MTDSANRACEREKSTGHMMDKWKGKKVRVVRGRKVPKGTEGIVFWAAARAKFNAHWLTEYVVGVALDDEKDERGRSKNVVFVQEDYIELVEPEVPYEWSEIDADDARFNLDSFDLCGICRSGADHTPAEHVEAAKSDAKARYRRTAAMEADAVRVYEQP